MPKSVSLHTPAALYRMFAGLMSRCTICVSYALSSASAICSTTAIASASGSGPCARRRFASDACIRSIAM